MSTPSRLLLITPDFPPNRGGVASYLGALARYVGDRMRVQTTDLLYRRCWPKWLRTTWLLVREASTYDMVVTSHVLPFGTAALLAQVFTKKPYVVIVHGLDIRLVLEHRFRRMLAGMVLRRARVVVANSHALAFELQMLKVTDAIVVYPCLETVAPVQKIEHSPRRLLTISRLVQRKGHERVFEALAELKRRGHADGIEYHIAGTGTYEVVLRERVSALQLQDLVIFHGDVDETERARLYASCDVFVMPVVKDPIDKEGFGLVYLEAAAHGLPSIATRIVGVDEAVIDGVTGVLVDDNDIQALATTIDHLLNDRNERERLGNAGRERAIREFLCSDQFAKLEAYL